MSQQTTPTQLVRLQSRVDVAEAWATHNPGLLDKEIGYESDTGRYKIGKVIDGEKVKWNDLPYASVGSFDENNNHIFISDDNEIIAGKGFTAFGNANKIGIKAFYIKAIDLENKKIYLSKEQVTLPTISTEDFTDATFETPAYEAQKDRFSLICRPYAPPSSLRAHFHFVSTITNVNHNVITYNEDLPFTELVEDTSITSNVFFVASKPEVAGIV